MLLFVTTLVNAQTKDDVESAETRVHLDIIKQKLTLIGSVELVGIKEKNYAFIATVHEPKDSQIKVKTYFYLWNPTNRKVILMFTKYNKAQLKNWLNERNYINFN